MSSGDKTKNPFIVHGPLPGVGTAARIEKGVPDAYRLARKPDGTLVLQGAYFWHAGTQYGHEWRDIPTVDIPEGA